VILLKKYLKIIIKKIDKEGINYEYFGASTDELSLIYFAK